MRLKIIVITFFYFLIPSISAQPYDYTGKRDYYFSGVVNIRPDGNNTTSFQGLKAGYYLTNFMGICLEAGYEDHSKQINEFIYYDKLVGRYAKLGLEFYTNIFKPKTGLRITYGFDYGISRNSSIRTYKYSGPVYGNRYETLNYDFTVEIEDLHFGLSLVKNKIRVTSKFVFGDNAKPITDRPYKLYAIAGCPNTASVEFSVGYQIMKSKSKPFKPLFGNLFKIFF